MHHFSSFSSVPISLSGGFSASLWVLLSGVPKRLNSVITKKENLFFLLIIFEHVKSRQGIFLTWFHHQNDHPPHSQLKMSEINPIRAPIFSKIPHPLLKKPVNPSFSVRVENTPNYSPVCQNGAVLHLACWLPKPLKSSCFLPPALAHRNQQTLPEH